MTAVIYSGNHMSLTRINTKEKLNKHIVVKPEARKKIIPIKKTNKQLAKTLTVIITRELKDSRR